MERLRKCVGKAVIGWVNLLGREHLSLILKDRHGERSERRWESVWRSPGPASCLTKREKVNYLNLYSFEGGSVCKSHRCEQSERHEKLFSSVPSFCNQDLHPPVQSTSCENILSPDYTRSCKLVTKVQQVLSSDSNTKIFLVPHSYWLFIVVGLGDFEAILLWIWHMCKAFHSWF